MSIFGNLSSMSLPDLLQWAGTSSKTGTLELEHQGVRKRIHFRKGRVISCSSDDPPTLLGQFLLSRGKITKADLRAGLERQQSTGEKLGTILVEEGTLTADELARQIAAKAEETIFGLFDWPDASFRFLEEAPPDPYGIEVDLRVEDVLLHGLKRHDEMRRLRAVFPDPGVVLRRTGRTPPPEIAGHRAARAIFESIDGRRTLAEILLHAHATECVALRFLHQLLRGGLIAIAEAPEAHEVAVQAGITGPAVAGAAVPSLAGGGRSGGSTAVAEAVAAAVSVSESHAASRIAEALKRLSDGEPEAALDLLQAVYREHPGEPSVRDLIGRAEAACRENSLAVVGLSRIPFRKPSADEPRTPEESFLLSVVDGRTDVRSILWVAPVREVDALRSLRRLVERGVLGLR